MICFPDGSSVRDYLISLYNKTDDYDFLYVSDLTEKSADSKYCFKCEMDWEKMNWEETDIEEVAEKIESIIHDLTLEYTDDFDLSQFDLNKIADIRDRIKMLEKTKTISRKIVLGNYLTKVEIEHLSKTAQYQVDNSEYTYLENFNNSIKMQAEKRVGKGCFAVELIKAGIDLRTATDDNKNILANRFTALFVVHSFAVSVVKTEIEDICDDDFLLKMNSRKSLAPLFVYLVLKDYSNVENKLTQNQICELLEEYPYEISIERKAVGRIIHNLTDSDIDIYSDSRKGTWYQKKTG